MNAKCEICCEHDAKVYCNICPLVHYYCEECLLLTHKSDSRKAHNVTQITDAFYRKMHQSIALCILKK